MLLRNIGMGSIVIGKCSPNESVLLFGLIDICILVQMMCSKSAAVCVSHQVMDSSMPLIGEHVEEDRQLVADLVVAKMTQHVQMTSPTSSLPRTQVCTEKHQTHLVNIYPTYEKKMAKTNCQTSGRHKKGQYFYNQNTSSKRKC